MALISSKEAKVGTRYEYHFDQITAETFESYPNSTKFNRQLRTRVAVWNAENRGKEGFKPLSVRQSEDKTILYVKLK